MYKVKETIVVEGIYDKIKLSEIVDSLIFVTDGFSVFNNKKAQKSLVTLAEKTGLVIFTDSDSAGLKIRNFVKQLVPKDQVKHAYIPEIYGKERRKASFSKEKTLGVEGIDSQILLNALRESGATIDGNSAKKEKERLITKADFFELGLSGRDNSSELRRLLASELGLPSKLSANMLLDVVNRLLTYQELAALLGKFNG
jgi:ribonuclease M5